LKEERKKLFDLLKKEDILPDKFYSFIALFNGMNEHLAEFTILKNKLFEMNEYQQQLLE